MHKCKVDNLDNQSKIMTNEELSKHEEVHAFILYLESNHLFTYSLASSILQSYQNTKGNHTTLLK